VEIVVTNENTQTLIQQYPDKLNPFSNIPILNFRTPTRN
jgi:hypothetical protein